jgi:fatty-acyl-CoA synthase
MPAMPPPGSPGRAAPRRAEEPEAESPMEHRKRTLGGVLDEAAERWGPREALVFGSRRWTFAELNAETDRVARALLALGVESGENIALWMTNRPEWVFVMFAVARIGACLVPLNTRYRTDDVAYTLRQSRSGTLVTLDRSGPVDYQGMLMETLPPPERRRDGTLAIDGYPDLKRVVVLGPPRLDHAWDWPAFMAGGAGVTPAALAARKAAVDPDGRMVICYTSGTTGHPKGAMHSHRPIRNTHERARLFGMTMNDVHMSYLPLFHIYGYSEITMAATLVGAKQILMDVFDAERTLDLAEQEGATVLHGFEAHWLDLLDAQARRPRRIAMRLGTLPSGVESTVPIADRVQDVFGPTVSGWGMSETWAFVSCDPPSSTREQRVHASGYPMIDCEHRVVDPDTGAERPAGVPGELLVRGYTVMDGYWDRPDATAAAIDGDGWMHTGDMAVLRPDGYLVFMGRYKDMLKVGGENVSPAEVEAYLRGMAEVRDAAVVAYPDPRLAEVPVAFVIREPGSDLPADALLGRMHGRMASFKIPKHVIFVDAYPMTSSGKIRKIELRAEARRLLG